MAENAAARKMTLASYLAKRGACKALTSIEAYVFGVPFPLVAGWARRHGAIEITDGMIEQLRAKIGGATTATTEKARRGLDAAMGVQAEPVTRAARVKVASVVRALPQFPGFVLRVGGARQSAANAARRSAFKCPSSL